MPASYEHLDPALVGNERRILVSELSGQSTILAKTTKYAVAHDKALMADDPRARCRTWRTPATSSRRPRRRSTCWSRRRPGLYEPRFERLAYRVNIEARRDGEPVTEATVKVRVGDRVEHTVSEGDGPVNALDGALRKALLPAYPRLAEMHLVDYKVRVVNARAGTAARVRVVIESRDGDGRVGHGRREREHHRGVVAGVGRRGRVQAVQGRRGLRGGVMTATDIAPPPPIRYRGWPADDPFRYGWRYVETTHPDGTVESVRVPLTEDDILHPRDGDSIVANEAHDAVRIYLKLAFRSRTAGRPGVVVLGDHLIDWQLSGLQALQPDVAVMANAPPWTTIGEGVYPVRDEGAAVVLVVEATSPSTRAKDFDAKLRIYPSVGVSQYVIVDLWNDAGEFEVRLFDYRRSPAGRAVGGLVPAGRVWLDAVECWLEIDGDGVLCRLQDGTPIGDYQTVLGEAQAERNRADAEQQRADAERQRADAERREREEADRRAASADRRAAAERQRAEAAEAQAAVLARRIAELEAKLRPAGGPEGQP